MLSKKWLGRYLLSIGVIVALFNFTPIPYIIGIEPVINVYWYENHHGENVMEMPSKGRYIDYNKPGLKRKFKKNYLKFWKWWEYFTHPRWKLEYYE